jgi:hypothetical protein
VTNQEHELEGPSGFVPLITIWNVALWRDFGGWRVQERKQRANRPIYWGDFGPPKTEAILPIQIPEMSGEMPLFDL